MTNALESSSYKQFFPEDWREEKIVHKFRIASEKRNLEFHSEKLNIKNASYLSV